MEAKILGILSGYNGKGGLTGKLAIVECLECRTLITENIRIIKADNLHKKLQAEKESRLSV